MEHLHLRVKGSTLSPIVIVQWKVAGCFFLKSTYCWRYTHSGYMKHIRWVIKKLSSCWRFVPKKSGLKAKCWQKIHRFLICLAFASECLSWIWSHLNASPHFFRVKAHSKNTVGIPVAVVFLFIPTRITMVSRAPSSLFGGRWIYQGRVTKQFNFHVSVTWWVLVAVFWCFLTGKRNGRTKRACRSKKKGNSHEFRDNKNQWPKKFQRKQSVSSVEKDGRWNKMWLNSDEGFFWHPFFHRKNTYPVR